MGPTRTPSVAHEYRKAPTGRWLSLGLAGGLVAAVALATVGEAVYVDGPPPAHTGGFDDDTCRRCHFDNDLNDPAGSLSLAGVPDVFIPRRSYRVTITLARPEMGRAGFQLAARFADDDGRGRQAGHLHSLDDRVQLVDGADSIVYAQHTESGSVLADQAETSWIVEWVPSDATAPVTLHVAANAANDDASEFGDYVYVADALTRPSP